MKHLSYLLTLALAAAQPALAAAPAAGDPRPVDAAVDAQALGLARQFVAIAEQGRVEAMLAGLRIGVASGLDAMEAGPQRASFERELDKAIAAAEPELKRQAPMMMEVYAQAYARAYSAAELRELIAFASSPAGRRYLTDNSAVEMDEAVSEAEMEMQNQLMPLFGKIAKMMCEHKAAAQFAGGDKTAKCSG